MYFVCAKSLIYLKPTKTSPIVDWLKALCQKIKPIATQKGVGVIGMSLTGNIAIPNG
jgi:hypothetical protein